MAKYQEAGFTKIDTIKWGEKVYASIDDIINWLKTNQSELQEDNELIHHMIKAFIVCKNNHK